MINLQAHQQDLLSKKEIAKKNQLREEKIRQWLESAIQSQIEGHLSDVLYDGIILCRFMITINDRSIPWVYQDKKRLKQNVYNFICALEDTGVPLFLLPNVEDIYQKRNVMRTIEALEALSRILEEDENYEGPLLEKIEHQIFVKGKYDQSPQVRRHTFGNEEEEPLSSRLHSPKEETPAISSPAILVTKDTTLKLPERPLPRLPSGSTIPTLRSNFNLEISKTLSKTSSVLFVKPTALVIKCVTRLQAAVRGHLARNIYRKLVRAAEYRARVAKEIYLTEETYVKNLTIVVELFMTPITASFETSEPIMTRQQFRAIFSEVEVILGYSRQLLSQLKPRYDNWSCHQSLGDIFTKITYFLKVYTQYVKDHDKRLATINEVKATSPKFLQFLDETFRKPETQKMQLQSFLILPVQRIPRYLLLLNDLVKHTDSEHKDYNNLVTAAKKIQEVAKYVDDRKIEAEAIWKVAEIEKSIVGIEFVLSQPHRRFIREGTLSFLPKRKDKTIFLFNDMLLVVTLIGDKGRKYFPNKKSNLTSSTAETQRQYKHNFTCPLKSMIFKNIEDGNGESNCFQIINFEQNVETLTLTVAASSAKDKEKWRDAIESAIEQFLEKQSAFEESQAKSWISAAPTPASNHKLHKSKKSFRSRRKLDKLDSNANKQSEDEDSSVSEVRERSKSTEGPTSYYSSPKEEQFLRSSFRGIKNWWVTVRPNPPRNKSVPFPGIPFHEDTINAIFSKPDSLATRSTPIPRSEPLFLDECQEESLRRYAEAKMKSKKPKKSWKEKKVYKKMKKKDAQ